MSDELLDEAYETLNKVHNYLIDRDRKLQETIELCDKWLAHAEKNKEIK